MCDALQAQVVLAFEQSLTNMTQRLQHLAVTANEKVSGLSAAITLNGGYRILLVLLICSKQFLVTIITGITVQTNSFVSRPAPPLL